jgi:hypothetical protein
MAYSPNEINLQRCANPSSSPLIQRFSLRSMRGIAAGLLLCSVLGFLLLWRPTYLQLRSLEKEKTYWQQVLRTGATNTNPDIRTLNIPTMDQLPDIIEQCRGVFAKEQVDVAGLNVERFGERRETGHGTSLDYSLVRLHLRGSWERIVSSLQALEGTQAGNIHLQEVVLDAEGGETLLRIYFGTGE